ncbi:MAG: hypothetical protein HZB45_15200 [Mycolicibacterium rufum]|nr:hypothetical protein [Mycolicibacterium rufum]
MTDDTAPEVTRPEGADPEALDDWSTHEGVTSRLIWSTPEQLPASLADSFDVRVVASQRVDGSIIAGDPGEGPFVYVANSNLWPDDARGFAAALTRAADLADRWAASEAAQ